MSHPPAISVACSIDNFNSAVCGSGTLAEVIPGDAGKVVSDSLDVGYAVCAAAAPSGGPGAAVCLGVAIYELLNHLYQFLESIFDWGSGSTFHGSLLPRPAAPSQANLLSTLGVPINGENLDRQTGKSTQSIVPSPTFRTVQ